MNAAESCVVVVRTSLAAGRDLIDRYTEFPPSRPTLYRLLDAGNTTVIEGLHEVRSQELFTSHPTQYKTS